MEKRRTKKGAAKSDAEGLPFVREVGGGIEIGVRISPQHAEQLWIAFGEALARLEQRRGRGGRGA